MDTIATNYKGYEQPEKTEKRKEVWAYNPEEIAGKMATQEYLKNKVKTDLKKTIPTTKPDIMGVEIDLSMYPEYADRAQKRIDALEKSPTDLESFIKQKGQSYWGDPEGVFFYKPLLQEEAEAHGVGDIFDNYYMGANIGKDIIGKDIRESYSEIPLKYANQLGKMEAKETREGLEKIAETKRKAQEALQGFWQTEKFDPLKLAGGGLTRTVGDYDNYLPDIDDID